MAKLVMTVKLGMNGTLNSASATVRNVEKGTVGSATFVGSKEDIEEMLKLWESNPDVKVKYE